MTSGVDFNFTPPGPVAAAYFASVARNQAICGPIGSAKTTTSLAKLITLAIAQRPSPRDELVDANGNKVAGTGTRRTKWCVVGHTYRKLWQTVIPTWWKRVPQSAGEWVGAKDAPAQHTLKFKAYAGNVVARVETTIDFVAIGEHRAEDVLRGYEPTGFFLNEADLLPEDVWTYCAGRHGRYPDMADGGPTWRGILADMNAPVIGSWADRVFWIERGDGTELFIQPGGVIEVGGRLVTNPRAENLHNLPPGYYETQIADAKGDQMYIRRMLRNQKGYRRDGEPVYPEFTEDLHCASTELAPDARLPLLLGVDAGRTPALIVGQCNAHGQWLILDEICGEGVGAKAFARRVNALLAERYREWTVPDRQRPTQGILVKGWGDPAAANPSDTSDEDDQSWLEIFSKATKIRFRAAPGGNRLHGRLEAVRSALTTMLEGGRPSFLLSPRCTMLRQGFAAEYRYRKYQVGGQTKVEEEPEKNEFSHPHDALQYLMLGGGAYDDLMERKRGREGPRQTQAADDDHPHGEYS